MKRTIPIRKGSLFFVPVFVPLLLIALLSSCEKEGRNTTPPLSQSSFRLVNSIGSIESLVDTGGLVAWFSFDSGSLRDLSTYHNKVIYNSAVPTADRNGVANNAYYFNGNSSIITVKNSPSLNPEKEITLFAIIKFDDFYEGACHGNNILFKGYNDNDPGVYLLRSYDGYYHYGTSCYEAVDKAHESFQAGFCTTGVTDTTQYIQTGKWYHLVYTYSYGVAKYYINGVLTGTSSGHARTPVNSSNLFIGGSNNPGYPYWFQGSIDQVAIFNRALNANQVARLSNY